MKTAKVEKTVYVTEDGKEFLDKAEAKAYEKKILFWQKLEAYEVPGPQITPFDPPKLLSYDYKWYKLNNSEDFHTVKDLLSSIIKRNLVVLPELKDFPDYIGFSRNHETVHILSNMIKQHEESEERWEYFIRFFTDVPEKSEATAF